MTPRTRSAATLLCVVGVLCGESVAAQAQTPDFSGTWKLNRSVSRITTGAGITGLGAGGAPPTLYISQAANGTVVIGSDINESRARTFKVGAELAHEAAGVKEQISLSADRQTLTVKVTATPGGGTEVSTTLVYTKVQGDDPCEKWPTPCRYAK